jgi:uncharacterized membrane protein YdjX (TVP38/TMEM64 family)
MIGIILIVIPLIIIHYYYPQTNGNPWSWYLDIIISGITRVIPYYYIIQKLLLSNKI